MVTKRNFLEMVPVRNITEFARNGDKITLLIPKFRNPLMQKWLIPSRRSRHIRVRLDENGSKVWELIDGNRNTEEICVFFNSSNPGESLDQSEARVTGFLRNLYKHRLIVFRNNPG